jgi:hypothetical protein
VEQQAVGQPGQRIVVGKAAKCLLRLLPPGEVADHQDDHPPVPLLDDAALHLHRQQLAGATAEGQLERHLAQLRRLQARQQALARLDGQREEQVDAGADRRVARIVEDGLGRAREPSDGALRVEQHDTVGDAVHHRVEQLSPLLACAWSRLSTRCASISSA